MRTPSRGVALGLVACSAAVAQSPLAQSRFASIPATFYSSAYRAAARGDIDGDGDIDLLLGMAASPIGVYVNDGSGRFSDESAARLASSLPLSCASIDLADVDGDGDLDALLGGRVTRANQVHLNNGLGVFTFSPGALPQQGNNTWSQVVADFDGDGDVDWLALNSSFAGGNTSRYYENDGTGSFTDVTASWLPVAVDEWSYISAEPATDLDGDGLLDVLTPAGTLLLNTGSALAPSAQQLPSYAGPPFLLRDVDGDGHVDVLASDGRYFFRNRGDATFDDASAGSIVPASSYFVRLCCDLDGDGDVDILRPYAIDWNDGSGVFSREPFTTSVGNFELESVFGDWDGDGDLEPPGWVNLLRHVDAAAAPQRGGIYDVSLHGRPGSAATPGLLFAALGSSALPLPGYGTLRLDPASMTLLGAAASTSPAHTVQLAVPNVPALAGTSLHLQGAVLDPLIGVRLTNAIVDTVQ